MIPAERAHLRVAAITDPGRKGKNNEDRYAVFAHHLGVNDPTPSLFAIVADGVGGHRAGEVAAELAVETIAQVVADSDANQPLETLNRALQQANRRIFAQARDNLSQQGMSTTGTCAWVIGERLYIASVGDSRVYLRRGKDLQQLTTDHTWVQEAISSGLLTPDQARDHPNAHVIRRHLGSQGPVSPDLRLRLREDESDTQAEDNQGLRLQPGDQVLICSDGLTDLVSDEEILAQLRDSNPDTAVEGLVALANSRGGHDNITIVLLEVPERINEKMKPASQSARGRLGWFILAIGSLFLLGGILIASLFWFRNQIDASLNPTSSSAPPLQSQEVFGVEATATIFDAPVPSQGGTALPPAIVPAGTEPWETQVLPTYTPWPTSTPAP